MQYVAADCSHKSLFPDIDIEVSLVSCIGLFFHAYRSPFPHESFSLVIVKILLGKVLFAEEERS